MFNSAMVRSAINSFKNALQSKYNVITFGSASDFNRDGIVSIFSVDESLSNVYRVFYNPNTTLILQKIQTAFYADNGKLFYDDPVDYRSADRLNGNPFNEVVRWVNSAERTNPHFTEYFDEDDNLIEVDASSSITGSTDGELVDVLVKLANGRWEIVFEQIPQSQAIAIWKAGFATGENRFSISTEEGKRISEYNKRVLDRV